MELAYAGLHQLCAPFLDRLTELPVPQRDALGTAFGLRPGRPRTASSSGWRCSTPAVGGRRGAPAGLRGRRRPVAGPRDHGDAGVRRPPAAAEPVALVLAAADRPTTEPAPRSRPGASRAAEHRRGGAARRSVTGRSTRACGTGSWPRARATRWRCTSCPATCPGRSWPSGSTATRPARRCPPARAGVPPPGAAPAAADPAAAARRRRRTGRRRPAAVAGRGAARPRPRRRGGRRGGRADRAPRPGAVPPPAGPVDGLPLGHPHRPAGGAPGAGRRHRRRGRPRPPGVAPGPRRPGRTRRWRACSSARPAGRCRTAGWPRPRRSSSGRGAHPRPGPPGPARAGRRPGQGRRRGLRRRRRPPGTAAVGPLDEAGRARTELLQAQLSFATDRGREALPLLLAAARGWSRSTPTSPGTPTWTRCPLHCSPVGWPRAPVPGRSPWRCGGAATRRPREAGRAAGGARRPVHRRLCARGGRVAPRGRGVRDGDLTMDEALRSAWLAAATAASLWDDAAGTC